MSVKYNTSVVRDGLVVYLDAANPKSYSVTSNTWSDISGNQNNGTLTNGPIFDANNKGNIIFDGVNDYVVVTAPQSITLNNFSYNVWVYQTNNGSYRTIIDRDDDHWLLTIYAGEIRFYDYTFPTVEEKSSGYFLDLDKWYNICVTHSQNGPIYFYVNGELINTSSSMTNATYLPTYFGIGAGIVSLPGSINEVWDGKMSVVQIYDKQLSNTEIQQNFNALKGRYGL